MWMSCQISSVCVCCMGAGNAWFLDVSVDLWDPALRPHSAGYTHSSNIIQMQCTASLSPNAYSSTKIPPHRWSHISVYNPKTFLSNCFWNHSFSIVPLLSVHCWTFQLWLSREICWLVLAEFKLVLAGLYWTMSSNWGHFPQYVKVACLIS